MLESLECKVHPLASALHGAISVPADKSIAHRALMLAAIANGRSYLSALPNGADVATTMAILRALGVRIELDSKAGAWVTGTGGEFNSSVALLDCQNSGTSLRMLAGLLAGMQYCTTLVGDASLSLRPMRRIVAPLQQMGANINCNINDCPPIVIGPAAKLQGINYVLPVASAQVKSAILFAGLFSEGTTSVTELIASRDHSEILLAQLGATITSSGLTTTIQASKLQAAHINIPGDISSAMFFITLAAIQPGSELYIHNVGLNPTRLGGITLLQRMGADIVCLPNKCSPNKCSGCEVFGSVRVRYKPLRAINIDSRDVPYAIDEIPAILIAAALAEGHTVLRGAQELRKKECDRLAAMASNLRAFGVQVQELEDGMIIQGQPSLAAAQLQAFGDHRVAMACFIGAALADAESTISDWQASEVSFPEFNATAASLGIRTELTNYNLIRS